LDKRKKKKTGKTKATRYRACWIENYKILMKQNKKFLLLGV
jgi:hypothetical protein